MHTHIHTDRLVDKCMHIGVNWQVSVRKALPKFITLQFQIIVSPLVWIFCRTPISYIATLDREHFSDPLPLLLIFRLDPSFIKTLLLFGTGE